MLGPGTLTISFNSPSPSWIGTVYSFDSCSDPQFQVGSTIGGHLSDSFDAVDPGGYGLESAVVEQFAPKGWVVVQYSLQRMALPVLEPAGSTATGVAPFVASERTTPTRPMLLRSLRQQRARAADRFTAYEAPCRPVSGAKMAWPERSLPALTPPTAAASLAAVAAPLRRACTVLKRTLAFGQ